MSACSERIRAATKQIQKAVDLADRSCASNVDGELVHPVSRCSSTCELALSHDGAAAVAASIARISDGTCNDSVADGYPGPDTFHSAANLAVKCVQGKCQYGD